jgi:transglutaminase-like putative cysteine protease
MKAAAIALLLSAALADAAIETVRSGAPVRWWAVAAVAGYFVAIGSLWRWGRWRFDRAGWTRTANVAFVLLAALLPATAWGPDGLDRGLRFIGQPTPVLLSAASAVAIAGAAFVLFRAMAGFPRAKRGVAVIGGYAVLAFALAAYARTPYRELFRGHSFWSWLPFWLQGAFIGGLIVLPLAILIQTIDLGLRRYRHAQLAGWTFHQTVALTMAMVMVLAAGPITLPEIGKRPVDRAIGPLALAMPSASELQQSRPSTLEVPQPPPSAPEDVEARLDVVAHAIARARYDLRAGSETIGAGLEPAFLFVRDKVRYESYQGVLRGAETTYTTRSGNAFDRSLLLAELLRLKGVRSRFAIGQLGAPEAERLFARIFDPAIPGDSTPPSTGAQRPPARDAQAFRERVYARARRDFGAIRAAIANQQPARGGPSREEVLREIQRHVWVQAWTNNAWIDLDPSFNDATPGRRYGTIEQTLDALPPESRQRVTVRIVTETLGTAATRETALEASFTVADVLDRQVFLAHAPGRASSGMSGAIVGALGVAAPDTWVPVLWVDGHAQTGKEILFGERQASAGLTDLLGTSSPATSSLAAEWLEIEIVFPDGRRDITRRDLLNRIDHANSTAAKPVVRPLRTDARGALAPRALHNIWFTAGRHNVAEYTTALDVLASRVSSADDSAAKDDFGEAVWPIALRNFAFLLWSDHVVVPALNDAAGARLYADSPRILIFSVGPDPDAPSDKFYAQIDLRRDSLRGVSRTPGDEAALVERRIWFGVAEGALEHEIAVDETLESGGNVSRVTSTSSLLNDAGVDAILDRGRIAIVPRQVQRGRPVGWWEIGPGGDTTAVLDVALNGSYGGGPWNSGGGIKPSPGRVKPWYTPEAAREELARRGRLGPRPGPQPGRGGGNEYLIVLVTVSMITLGVTAYYSYKTYKRIQNATKAVEGVGEADGGLAR